MSNFYDIKNMYYKNKIICILFSIKCLLVRNKQEKKKKKKEKILRNSRNKETNICDLIEKYQKNLKPSIIIPVCISSSNYGDTKA